MHRSIITIALGSVISLAALAPAMSFTLPHVPVPSGSRVMVLPGFQRPGQPGPDPRAAITSTKPKVVPGCPPQSCDPAVYGSH
jgi:hypothetical protein